MSTIPNITIRSLPSVYCQLQITSYAIWRPISHQSVLFTTTVAVIDDQPLTHEWTLHKKYDTSSRRRVSL